MFREGDGVSSGRGCGAGRWRGVMEGALLGDL